MLQRTNDTITQAIKAIQVASGVYKKTIPNVYQGKVTEVTENYCTILYLTAKNTIPKEYIYNFSDFTSFSSVEKKMKIIPKINSMVRFVVYDNSSKECYIVRYSEIELITFDFNVQQLGGKYSMVNGENILQEYNKLVEKFNNLLDQLNTGIPVVSNVAKLTTPILKSEKLNEDNILNKSFKHNN